MNQIKLADAGMTLKGAIKILGGSVAGAKKAMKATGSGLLLEAMIKLAKGEKIVDEWNRLFSWAESNFETRKKENDNNRDECIRKCGDKTFPCAVTTRPNEQEEEKKKRLYDYVRELVEWLGGD